MRVAALQLIPHANESQRLAQAHELIQQALDRRVDLIAFPEGMSSEIEGPESVFLESLQEWAAEYDVWILSGSFLFQSGKAGSPKKPKKTSQKASKNPPASVPTHSCVLITPDGEGVARYDQLHSPHPKIKVGKKPVIFEYPETRIGFSIGWDLWSPSLYRDMATEGAQVIFLLSSLPQDIGRAQWDSLTRARAIENQVYLVAAAQGGAPSTQNPHGHSRIIDPSGRIIAERPSGTGMVWADLDMERVEEIRRKFPLFNTKSNT